jgi:hypothetical protein
MGAKASRPVTRTCDNTLSRHQKHVFIVMFSLFCRQIEEICDDYLKRGMDAIVYHALFAYIRKHPYLAKNAKDIMRELVADVTTHLEGFIKHVNDLRGIVGRMNITVKHTSPASFLEQLSANPICIHILSQMGCRTMMVGGQMTTFKKLVGQECWRDGKLNTFFSSLTFYLKQTFDSFHIVSTSEMKLKGQVLELTLQILENPDFGKQELSEVEKVIKEVLLRVKLDQL